MSALPDHHRYAEAVLFMIEKHGDQRRKDGRPYIIHPLRVAETVRAVGGIEDYDVLLAALFHDLIEDTDCSYSTIEFRFGASVADMVADLSGDMRLPRAERRADVIERARRASKEVRTVRLADRLDNLLDMNGFSEQKKRAYAEDGLKLLDACRGVNAALEAELQRVCDELIGR